MMLTENGNVGNYLLKGKHLWYISSADEIGEWCISWE